MAAVKRRSDRLRSAGWTGPRRSGGRAQSAVNSDHRAKYSRTYDLVAAHRIPLPLTHRLTCPGRYGQVRQVQLEVPVVVLRSQCSAVQRSVSAPSVPRWDWAAVVHTYRVLSRWLRRSGAERSWCGTERAASTFVAQCDVERACCSAALPRHKAAACSAGRRRYVGVARRRADGQTICSAPHAARVWHGSSSGAALRQSSVPTHVRVECTAQHLSPLRTDCGR